MRKRSVIAAASRGGRGASAARALLVGAALVLPACIFDLAETASSTSGESSSGSGAGGAAGGGGSSSGGCPPAMLSAPPSGALVHNGSFESGEDGWNETNVYFNVAGVADAPQGKYVARLLCKTDSECSLCTESGSAFQVKGGATYTIRVWARSATDQGKHAVLRLMDTGDTALLAASEVELTSCFTKIEMTGTVDGADASQIDARLCVTLTDSTKGTTLDIDMAEVTEAP